MQYWLGWRTGRLCDIQIFTETVRKPVSGMTRWMGEMDGVGGLAPVRWSGHTQSHAWFHVSRDGKVDWGVAWNETVHSRAQAYGLLEIW